MDNHAHPDGVLQSYEFNGHPIPLIPHDGDLWVTGEDIGGALGYPDARVAIAKVYERNREELNTYSCVVKLSTQVGNEKGQRRSVRVYNEEGIMIITMLSRQPKAAEFRAWAVQILKAYRRGELVMTTPGARDYLLELCIRESGRGNVAAMDILITRYGHRPQIVQEQKFMLACLSGKAQILLPYPPDQGAGGGS